MQADLSVSEGDATDPLEAEIGHAFRQLRSALDSLIELGERGDLLALGPSGLISLGQRFEQHRSALAAFDALVIEAADEERLVEHTRARSTAGALAEVLRISRAEAAARVRLAELTRPRNGFSSGNLDPARPVFAGAVRAGEVTCYQARVIGRCLNDLSRQPHLSTAENDDAERLLVQQAAALGPEDLQRVTAKIYDVLTPDGALPREEVARARRGITIVPEKRDGTHEISGSITRVMRAKLHAVLSPLAAPRPAEDGAERDSRSAPQRLHDALEDACDRLLRSGGLPASGGTPATVHLVIDADRLVDEAARHNPNSPGERAAAGTALDERVTFAELLRLAHEAEIVPTFISAREGVVRYGRARRIASDGQTNALIARDGGCSFPSCDAPPEWCDRHHVVPWSDGGPTDLDNLTLVCGYHHRAFQRRGWTVRMRGGVPEWIPPTYIDPHQKPAVHARIADRTGGRLVAEEAEPVDAADPAAPRPGLGSGLDQKHAIEGGRGAPSFALTQHGACPADENGLEGLGRSVDEIMARELAEIDDLSRGLAGHVDEEEAEEFRFELAMLIGGFLGERAPVTTLLGDVDRVGI